MNRSVARVAPIAPRAATPAIHVPTIDLHHGDHRPEVHQLQETLVKLGYMTEAEVRTGPGIYGPKTHAAVQKLQDAWHIHHGNGDFGSNTRAAVRAQLSGKKPPGASTSGRPSPRPVPSKPAPSPSPAPGGGSNRADPSSFFLTQNKTKWNPGGSMNANCGPTSLAMAALAFGKLPPGTSKANPEKLIEAVRRDMCNGVDNIHSSTNVNQVINGAHKLGMSASKVGNVGDVDRALATGKMVVALGNPGAYGKHPGGHFILVTGKAKDGKYVINDPVYTGRPGVEISPAQLRQYLWSGAAVGR